MSTITLVLCSFMLGAVAKYADLFNDNGLKEPFPGASYLSGVVWGICGMGIVWLSPASGLVYIAHVLYWFQRVKLDAENHSIAGIMIIFSGILMHSNFLLDNKWDLLALFLAFSSTGYLHSYLKNNCQGLRIFLRLRLRIYLIPLAYSIFISDYWPFMNTCIGMLGTELVTYFSRDLKDKDFFSNLKIVS